MIIAIVLAIVAVCVSVVYMNLKTISIEKELAELNAERVTLETVQRQADERISNIVTVHNATIEHYDNEIDQIINRLNQITEDIARIDHDQTEIRKYYINYREPSHPNGGVPWSETVKVSEDAIDG